MTTWIKCNNCKQSTHLCECEPRQVRCSNCEGLEAEMAISSKRNALLIVDMYELQEALRSLLSLILIKDGRAYFSTDHYFNVRAVERCVKFFKEEEKK